MAGSGVGVRKVGFGNCGWSDASILKCGRFYPSFVKTAEDRLKFFSTRFPCVEVDSSCYAIPRTDSVSKWVASVPKGFTFHFKAFGLLTSQSMPVESLPRNVREAVPPGRKRVSVHDLPRDVVDEVWKRFNDSLQPVIDDGKMGAVVFQFHLGFDPCREKEEYVKECRRMLRPDVVMAAEFRQRDWIRGKWQESTLSMLREQNIVLIAADELEHETFGQDPGPEIKIQERLVTVTCPKMIYVRVHRRAGTERILPDSELETWVNELTPVLKEESGLEGPVYFLWGTDHEDQPIKNAARLETRLGAFASDWAQRQSAKQRSVASFFGNKPKAAAVKAEAATEKAPAVKAEAATEKAPAVKAEAAPTDPLQEASGKRGSTETQTPMAPPKRVKATPQVPKGMTAISTFFGKK